MKKLLAVLALFLPCAAHAQVLNINAGYGTTQLGTIANGVTINYLVTIPEAASQFVVGIYNSNTTANISPIISVATQNISQPQLSPIGPSQGNIGLLTCATSVLGSQYKVQVMNAITLSGLPSYIVRCPAMSFQELITVTGNASGTNTDTVQISVAPAGTPGSLLPTTQNVNGLLSTIYSVGAGDNTAGATFDNGGNGATPLVPAVGVWYFNGGNWDKSFYCLKTTFISALGAATTQIVAAAASQKIRVCSLIASDNSATQMTIKLVEGTGANCATGQASLTGTMLVNANTLAGYSLVLPFGATGGFITLTAGDALCVTGTGAGSTDVTITYIQY